MRRQFEIEHYLMEQNQKFGEILIQHEVRVLMTRGVNGMYIYACDPELQKALLEAAK